MTIKKSLTSIVVAGALALGLTGCGDGKPEIRKYEDVTGDGIKDVLMYEDAFAGATRGNYLFIGKEDGTFTRTQKRRNGEVKYFFSNDGVAYFFDGKFYKPSPKQE